MSKYILSILLIAIGVTSIAASYNKHEMLMTNRVVDNVAAESATCQECESIIEAIVKASKDPKKLDELKLLLGLLCKETSYAEECRLFVSQLDNFIEKLLPYLKDAHQVCRRIHLCSNNRIESFHRLLVEFEKRRVGDKATGSERPQIICDECEFAVKELKQAVENKELQTDVRNFLRENVCAPMRSYRGFCDLVVDEYLPQFIQQLDAILTDPHQVCVDVHACPASNLFKARKYTYDKSKRSQIEEEAEEFWSRLTMEGKNGEILAMSCFECKLMVDSAQEEMIANRKNIAGDIQRYACNEIVPSNMTESCNDFLQLYLPTVVQMTVEQVTASGFCHANKCCPMNSLSAYRQFSFNDIEAKKCDVITSLEKFVEKNLQKSGVERFVEMNLIETFCDGTFSFFAPFCQHFMQSLTPRLIETTVELASNSMFSKISNC